MELETPVVEQSKMVMMTEAIDLTEAKIDPEKRVISGVVLIKAGMSVNRKYYPEKVLQESAPLFEGVHAFADHPEMKDLDKTRGIRNITGWYTNVRYQEGKLLADRHFTRTQAGNDVWAIVEDIISGRAPASLAGLSINAVGPGRFKKYDDGDAIEVEGIRKARSVDDVTLPAAGGSYTLLASADDDFSKTVMEALTYQNWLEARPEFVEKLKREYKAVRLEEETKSKLAEADQRVKAANESLVNVQTALEEANERLTVLSEERDAALAKAQSKERLVEIIDLLHVSQLPQSYVVDLRQRLPNEPVEKWKAIIETERSKAKSAGSKSRVDVSGGGGQVVNATVITPSKPDPLADARKKIAAASTPEELKAVLSSLGR